MTAAAETEDDELVPQELAIFTDLSCPWILWPAERAPDPLVDRLHDAGISLRRLGLANPGKTLVLASFVHVEGDHTVAEFESFFAAFILRSVRPEGPSTLKGAIFVLAFPEAP